MGNNNGHDNDDVIHGLVFIVRSVSSYLEHCESSRGECRNSASCRRPLDQACIIACVGRKPVWLQDSLIDQCVIDSLRRMLASLFDLVDPLGRHQGNAELFNDPPRTPLDQAYLTTVTDVPL